MRGMRRTRRERRSRIERRIEGHGVEERLKKERVNGKREAGITDRDSNSMGQSNPSRVYNYRRREEEKKGLDSRRVENTKPELIGIIIKLINN